MFKTNTKGHRHPSIRLLSKSKTQLVNQRKQQVAFSPGTAHSPEKQSYRKWWGADSPILNDTPVVCIITSYNIIHIRNACIHIYIYIHVYIYMYTYIYIFMWKNCLMPADLLRPRPSPLQWRHNGRYGRPNHRRVDCLFNRLFRRRLQKKSKLRVTVLCEGNSPGQ